MFGQILLIIIGIAVVGWKFKRIPSPMREIAAMMVGAALSTIPPLVGAGNWAIPIFAFCLFGLISAAMALMKGRG